MHGPVRSNTKILIENHGIRQIKGEAHRRWFSSKDLDLIVWYDLDGSPMEFQLCYSTGPVRRALTWTRARGFRHEDIDDGEDVAGAHKMTPLLFADGKYDLGHILDLFENQSCNIEQEIKSFVIAKLTDA